MKIKFLLIGVFCFSARMASAEPVMNLITINTADGAGYAKWTENSAATIGEANGAMAMGASIRSGGDG